jgi:HTH-type transcriptional regulator, glycine betaine synthesis regulator
MAFWGFRKNLGRIWALLYLSPHPLTAADLCEQLKLSTGSVSMALNELQRWAAVHKRFVAGDRRDHYEAEQDIWGTVSRVMQQREVQQIALALDAFKTAEDSLGREVVESEAEGDPEGAAAARYRAARVSELEELALAGKDLLGLLLGQRAPDELVPAQKEPIRRTRLPRAPTED